MQGAEMIRGLDKHLARVKAITSPRGQQNISRALFVAADEMKAHAQHLITAGSISGKGHIASLPGQPPNADTHILDTNIESYQPAPLVAEVRSEAPYAAAMEFGTSKIAARPYMAPTREAKRGRVKELVEEAINATIRGGK
jgi:hypothetical protein